ncbi:MAG TPA: hypothetical protein VNA25_29305 [Phycisphaerae bacterium]|nr:hypothetical protein [Phycisphaerae bacterium]
MTTLIITGIVAACAIAVLLRAIGRWITKRRRLADLRRQIRDFPANVTDDMPAKW